MRHEGLFLVVKHELLLSLGKEPFPLLSLGLGRVLAQEVVEDGEVEHLADGHEPEKKHDRREGQHADQPMEKEIVFFAVSKSL